MLKLEILGFYRGNGGLEKDFEASSMVIFYSEQNHKKNNNNNPELGALFIGNLLVTWIFFLLTKLFY